MAISATGSTTSATNSLNQTMGAFRDANFLQIILSEITNQDPLNPADTSKMVESMRQLQTLANSTYEKFRADVTWGQQLVGQVVNVGQMGITADEAKTYTDAGLKPDVGFGTVDGRIDSFKVVNETVWVSVNGKDYPIDNVKQVHNDVYNTQALADASTRLLGMRVQYAGTDASGKPTSKSGIVTSVGYDEDGKLSLGIDSKGYIHFNDITAITVPSSTTTN